MVTSLLPICTLSTHSETPSAATSYTLRTSPLAVGELATRFPVSRPAISRHLRVLEDAGLVEHRTQGARSVYAVRVQGFASVREFLDEFWDTALSRLEELAKE